MKRGAIALAVLLAGLAGSLRGQDTSAQAFMLGPLSVDGRFTPLVHFSNGTWSAPWPDNQPLPATLDAIPSSWWPGFFAEGLPRQDGSSLWFVQAMATGRLVQVWASDRRGQTFTHIDDEPRQIDHEEAGAFVPFAIVGGVGTDVVFGSESLYDGGTFQMLSVDKDGARELISAGGGSCE